MNIQKYEQIFHNYTEKYLKKMENEEDKIMIDYKIKHTYRVCENMIQIAKSCNLSQNEINIAKLIGLYHDFGRFSQYDRYRTYDDKKSVNHAVYSSDIIIKENMLEELNEEEKNIVIKAVRYHNVYLIEEIEEVITEREKFFLKMIRDADRLDIYKAMADIVPYMTEKEQYIWYNEREELGNISMKIYTQIMNNISPNMKDCTLVAESKFARMSWVYNEFSFKETLNIVNREKYFEKIYLTIKSSNTAKQMYDHILEFTYKLAKSEKLI